MLKLFTNYYAFEHCAIKLAKKFNELTALLEIIRISYVCFIK